MGLPKTWKCHKWIQMASSMGKTWGFTSFTYLFYVIFWSLSDKPGCWERHLPYWIGTVAHCLPVLEGGCGAMHPPHHASAWTLPAQWLSGTHSQSQTTLRWVWFPKTFTVRCDHPRVTPTRKCKMVQSAKVCFTCCIQLEQSHGFRKALITLGVPGRHGFVSLSNSWTPTC